ncbi:MAG: hypothetical protein ACNA78_03335 [Balneolaceae bacterium]
MWNVFHRLLLVSFGLFFMAGCATVYVPNSAHTNMMSEKGELHASVQLGTQGGDIMLGYALSDQFGLVGSYSGSEEFQNGEQTGSHDYGEAALVFFPQIKGPVQAEFLGGIGFGNAMGESSILGVDRIVEGDYSRPFLQGNLSVNTTSFFRAGVATRFAHVNFTNLESTADLTGLDTSALFFEPTAFVQLGRGLFRVESQFGISEPMFKSIDDLAFEHEPVRFSIGARFLFNL